jgi:hypothetical protein
MEAELSSELLLKILPNLQNLLRYFSEDDILHGDLFVNLALISEQSPTFPYFNPMLYCHNLS